MLSKSIKKSYRPTSQEIAKFKKDNVVSNLFNTKSAKFLETLTSEISEIEAYLNEVNVDDIDSDNPINFYGATEDYFELSPFYSIEYDYGGITFTSSEQFYDFAKAMYSNNTEMAFKILIQSKSNYCFKYAKQIEENEEFVDNSIYVLYIANKEKFKTPKLKEILKETGNKLIQWANPYSNDLGTGKKGDGENAFGKILMIVRENV